MNHEETTKSWSRRFVIKCHLHRIRNFELANFSASSVITSISVFSGSLDHETCNVSLLKYDRNSAETISRCSIMQVLMLSGKSILFIFRRLSNTGSEVVDPTLIRGCQTPTRAVSPASLALTSLTVSLRPCKDKLMSFRWLNTSHASITTSSSF